MVVGERTVASATVTFSLVIESKCPYFVPSGGLDCLHCDESEPSISHMQHANVGLIAEP